MRAVLAALALPDFSALVRLQAPEATVEQLSRVHPQSYVEAILSLRPEPGDRLQLDGDTVMSHGSARAAQLAAGGAVLGVDEVMRGAVSNAFVAVRPPGHHAEPLRPMGFCLFNTAAVAAAHARAAWGLARVAVVDFDVHHGNGTQAIFSSEAGLFYGSSHQHPCYPGTGFAGDRGVADNIFNVPLAPGTGGSEFSAGWHDILLPALDAFAPELLIVSAGFDAHRLDPLAELQLDDADFADITRALTALAARHCVGRVVSVLEGGYDLGALASASAAHVRVLMQAG